MRGWTPFLAGLFGPLAVGWFLWGAGAGSTIVLVMIFLLWIAEALFFLNGVSYGDENASRRYEVMIKYCEQLAEMRLEKSRKQAGLLT
jgi:hypothetical protein